LATIDPKQIPAASTLQDAFATFVVAAEQLEATHSALSRRVEELGKELAAASGKLGAIVESMPTGLLLIDAEGRIGDHNVQAEKILGGKLHGRIWAPNDFGEPTGIPDHWRFRQPAETPLNQITMAGHRICRVVDRTERALPSPVRAVYLEEVTELIAAREQLEKHEQLAAMGRMAAELAHQLRTPLAAATIYAGNLRSTRLGEDARRSLVDKVCDRLSATEQLVRDTLQLIRKGRLEKKPVSADELLQASMQTAIARAAEKSVGLIQRGPIPAAYTLGEANQLVATLVVCIDNAIDASASGQTVEVQCHHSGGTLEFAVADQGSGIPGGIAEHIFEPFFTSKANGTGLGLAMARSRVRAHGGEIAFGPRPGGGTIFRIRLPALEAF
jgi:two-component system sensor histidine kinase FlrB